MDFLYVTSDRIGRANTGGGVVTGNECQALSEMGSVVKVDEGDFGPAARGIGQRPCWIDDEVLAATLINSPDTPRLAHFYAGTFSKSIALIKSKGCKVTYTCAAHDKEVSKREQDLLGIRPSYAELYPHLVVPELWQRYVQGYRDADLVICPGKAPACTMKEYGCERIAIIPHGVNLPTPEAIKPMPTGPLVVGYMGSYSADKGVRYLLDAWRRLDYQDGATLRLAGAQAEWGKIGWMVQRFGGKGKIELVGWQKDVADFYAGLHLYVQPSATEGFGLEVLESLAHGRTALCSNAAGAADVVAETLVFEACNAEQLAEKIDWCGAIVQQDMMDLTPEWYAKPYTWGKIRERYKETWRGLLEGK